jgi:hypothetical protein
MPPLSALSHAAPTSPAILPVLCVRPSSAAHPREPQEADWCSDSVKYRLAVLFQPALVRATTSCALCNRVELGIPSSGSYVSARAADSSQRRCISSESCNFPFLIGITVVGQLHHTFAHHRAHSQTYKNFTLVLIGDGLDQTALELAHTALANSQIPEQQVVFRNMDAAKREVNVYANVPLENCTLWCFAGINAVNTGLDLIAELTHVTVSQLVCSYSLKSLFNAQRLCHDCTHTAACCAAGR